MMFENLEEDAYPSEPKRGWDAYIKMRKFDDSIEFEKSVIPFNLIVNPKSRGYVDKIAAKGEFQNVPTLFSVCDNSKPFFEFSDENKDIIYDELRAENLHPDIQIRKFDIIPFHINALPPSSIEAEIYDKSMNEEDYADEINHTTRIENEIIERGFDEKSMIILKFVKSPYPNLQLIGGNHRIQAIRNLIKSGVMDKNIYLNSIIVCPQ